MAQTLEKIIDRIKKVRTRKQQSIHNCAMILDISKENYLKFESGEKPLSLPEIELIAIYLGIPLENLFDSDPVKDDSLLVLQDEVQPQYRNLRQKMIRARFKVEKAKRGISLEKLHQETGISLETLTFYENGVLPIPIHHLMQISEALSLSMEAFINQEITSEKEEPHKKIRPNWQQEYPEDAAEHSGYIGEAHSPLELAISMLPIEDQAAIAKTLLEKLKTL